MKTKKSDNERAFSKSVTAVCSFLLLMGLLFFYAGCSDTDDNDPL
jgi:hypothetical protein